MRTIPECGFMPLPVISEQKQLRVKTPTIYQMEMVECGAASLAMILAYWGCHVPLEQLRVDTGVTRDGCNAFNILKGAEKYGLETHGYHKEIPNLLKLPMPVIIHWNFNHFVVLEGTKGNRVYINDPAFGRRVLTLEDLDECYTGVVLTFSRTGEFRKIKKNSSLKDFMLSRLSGQRSALLSLILLGFLLILPGFVMPTISQLFIDRVLNGGETSLVLTLVLILCLSALFQTFLRYYRGRIQIRLNQKISLLSAHALFRHMFRLPVSFFEQRDPGELVTRNENNDSVNDFLIGDLTTVILELFTAVFYLILLLRYSGKLTLLGIAGLVINLLISRYASSVMSTISQKQEIDGGKLSGMVFSGLRISETIKAAGVENEYASRLTGQQARSAGLEQRAGRLQSLLSALTGILSTIFSSAMLIYGGMEVIRGRLTAGMLTAFLSLFGSFAEPVQEIMGFIQKVQLMKADMSRVEDISHYTEDECFSPENGKVPFSGKLTGKVDIRGFVFGYNKLSGPLIKNLELHIESGRSVALVGASGSGKSTIGRVIGGLYAPWEGEIRFDGVERKDIPPGVLHASIATVSQNVVLFSGTIRDNITMWNENILEEDMVRAAKDACIHDVIVSRTGAYDSHLEENGRNLSGGQRQRVEIARALALNPSILIMDEATSALDPATEKEIVDNIKRRGCTCIIVAHRLSTIRDCDEILVLERGNVVQRGSHQELIRVEGRYRDLVNTM